MKPSLTLLEFAIVVALMLKGADLVSHAGAQGSLVGWSLLLVPAAWFHLHLIGRERAKRSRWFT